MAIKVLIVDRVIEPAMNIISHLGIGEVDVAVVNKVDQAINNIKQHQYHLIIFGDKLKDNGTTFDVATAIKRHEKNRRTPIICTGSQRTRLTKLHGLLSPRAIAVDCFDEKDVQSCVKHIRDRFDSMLNESK